MITILSLNGKWNGKYLLPGQSEVSFDAEVPGCAHTDLLKNGIIKDYFLDYQSQDCQFIENAEFEYETTFHFEGDTDGIRLSFDCLDTFCDIWLNGHKIGFCNNMFLPWDFDVASYLTQGVNKLQVRFYPPVEQVKDKPKYKGAFTNDRITIRRMQCTFGWDWVDRFVTMGIMGDVKLYRYTETEIDDVYIATTALDSYGAELEMKVSFKQLGEETDLVWSIVSPSGDVVWSQRRALEEPLLWQKVSLGEPQLWWPNGYGKQPLYTLQMTVYDKHGQVLQQKDITFGIRTIRILELQDKEESDNWNISKKLQEIPHIKEGDQNEEYFGFQVLVNGCRVFCKGGNWVPCEPFPSAVTEEKCKELLRLAAEGNINMIRVWGGGVVESDVFYDTCDRLGILVIQDFQMACGSYPEKEEYFLNELRKEAAVAAKRIRNHPSLAWWTGDNENSAAGHYEKRDYDGRQAANLALEPTVKVHDPYRRVLPSSPYGGKPFRSVTCGNAHGTMDLIWQFKQFRDSDLTDYHDIMLSGLSRFNSETPIFGAPAFSSMKRFLSEDKLYDEACLEFHTKNNPADILIEFPIYMAHRTFAEKMLGKFQNYDDQLMKMRCIQYEWVRYMVEMYRRNKGYAGGILFWMYNDCWPSDSWSVVDYYTNPKAGWYAFKNVGRSTVGSIYKDGNSLKAVVMNDGRCNAKGTVKIALWNTQKAEPQQEQTIPFEVKANEVIEVGCFDWNLPDENHVVVMDVKEDGENGSYRTVYFPKRIVDLNLPSQKGEQVVKVAQQGDDFITIQADKYVHMVDLDGDYVFEDNFFTMLPGETRTIGFRRTALAASTEIKIYAL